MSVTDQDARALAYLAGRIRDETTGPHWDQPGIDVVVNRLVVRDLPTAAARVVHHAADPEARTPAAMLRPFTPKTLTEDTAPRNPTPAEACRTCGGRYPTCCDQPSQRPAPSQHRDDHLAALRAAKDAAAAELCACGVRRTSCIDHKPARDQEDS